MKKSLPATLGRYQIQSLLGRGGMGEVYKAFDPSLDRIVALKTIRLDADNPMFLERLYREAKACGRLRHPRIVTVYDLGELEGIVFIAMEYLEGENLASAIDRAALTTEQKFDVLLQMLDALQYAHSEGVIHRDVKPSNVLVLPDRTIKLLDFGLARVVRADALTVSGAVMGTPSYMSPEQLTAQAIDGRTDVYSTGVVAYEMFTQRRAFDGETLTAVMLKVLSEQAAPMSTKLSATFPELERVIRRAMAKSPNDRYASAADMRAALEAFVSASRSELTLLDTDGFRQALDAVPDGRTLITGNRAVARGSTEADARGTSHAGSPQSAMPSQTGAPVSQSAVVTSNAPASQHDQSMSPPAPSPQPVLPLAAPAAVPPMPPPVVAEPIVSAWPVLRIGWWIGAVTMVLAVGVGVMLMAGRGLSPTRDAVDPRPATPDTKGRGAPNSTGVDGVAGPATSGTPRDLSGSATPPPSRESAQDQKVPQVADSSQTTTTRTDRGPAVQNNQATAPRQTTGAAARETAVYVDVRRSDAALAGALAGALKDKGVPVSGNASTSRWTVSATVQISVRKSPIGDTSAMTADYVGSVEISDAATGMRQTLPFDGHALDFGEQVVRAAAVRRAAEEIAGMVQGVLR